MSENFTVPIAKHLEDQDDLQQGRDADLVSGQEHLAQQMAESIYKHSVELGYKVLVFCVSPKQRAVQTATMVKEKLAEKGGGFKILTEIDENLREIDQGTFVLPENYKPGDEFIGLKIAGRIFSSETFSSDRTKPDNLDYRFGDPLPQADGSLKYPELQEYFVTPGESYRDILLRFYPEVIKLSENLPRFGNKTGAVVFTHGQPHQIFSNLAEVARMVKEEGFTFDEGSLPRVCWDLYQAKRRDVIPFGQMVFVSLENAVEPQMIALLKKEIEYLQKTRPSSR